MSGCYIAADAAIVHSPVFESALCKLSANLPHSLTEGEKVAMEKLKLLNPVVSVVDVVPQVVESNILTKARDAHLRNSYVIYFKSVLHVLEHVT